MAVAANLDRMGRVIGSAAAFILAAVIAVGTSDRGIAQTVSVSQPVTVLRGQPATPSNQADQSSPTVGAPYPSWYPYPYDYTSWWSAGYPWGWGWGAPWGWGWPAGVAAAYGGGGCFNCRLHPAFLHRRFFHPAFVHPGFTGFGHPGFVPIGVHAGFSGGIHGGRR